LEVLAERAEDFGVKIHARVRNLSNLTCKINAQPPAQAANVECRDVTPRVVRGSWQVFWLI
jgi:hypothetical protein